MSFLFWVPYLRWRFCICGLASCVWNGLAPWSWVSANAPFDILQTATQRSVMFGYCWAHSRVLFQVWHLKPKMAYFAILVRDNSKSSISIFDHCDKLYLEIQKSNQTLKCTLLLLILTFLGWVHGQNFQILFKSYSYMKDFILIILMIHEHEPVLLFGIPTDLSIFHFNSK